MTSPLAILGGERVCSTPWPSSNTIGEAEKHAVLDVMDSGVLSSFRGAAGPDFLGGPRVQALEEAWAHQFGTRYAVSFNSLTSGLHACIGAAGVEPGDEVIVPPLTMSASATCVVNWGGIPVFADLDRHTCCLDPASMEERITPRTRAVVVVHLFGYPADMDTIMEIARRHGLVVIEDAAQAPGARYKGRWVGGIGDMGGFSLNYHKTIHSGEGGVIVTDDEALVLRLRLIRNHGEAVVREMQLDDIANTLGGNFRMTEIEAAIAFVQLARLEELTKPRTELASFLDRELADIDGIECQKMSHRDSRHVYYFYPMLYDEARCGLPRELFVAAVRAEGIELREKYGPPVYWEPLYQKRVAFGRGHFPFKSPYVSREVTYDRGLCPIAEDLYERSLIFGKFCRWPLTTQHAEQVVTAMKKVLAHGEDLAAVPHSV